jgi:peptide/nickel transport system permease protein
MAAYLPPGPLSIITVLSISGWAWGARVMRAQTLSLREKDFVAAALVSGESHLRIIFFDILPNMISLVVANIIGSTIYAIGAEVGLEFLGLGNISKVSWGSILYWARNTAALPRGAWWVFLPAGLCVALTGFALSMINFSLDEITNPRLRKETTSKHGLRKIFVGSGQPTPVIRNLQ